MLHHIKQTADGFITLLGAIGFFSISANTADWTMKIISFLLGSIVSILAAVYYYRAIKNDNKKKSINVEKVTNHI
jgi:membrane protein implicated in regulation of membrane protease activity